MTKNVYLVMFDGVQLLDVSGPAGVLAMLNHVTGKEAYKLHYVSSSEAGKITANNDMVVFTESLPEINKKDIIIVPGALEEAMHLALKDCALMSWLEKNASQACLKISVCLGAFFFAELGWLSNKRATTHWASIGKLKDEYPDIQVVEDSLYQNDGDIWSSGGVLSGIDMVLAIVARNFGFEVTLQIAQLLVMYIFRSGEESQYSVPIGLQSASKDKSIVSLIAWLETRLDKATSVKDMAEQAQMSVRKLHGRSKDFFGCGPSQLFFEMRMDHAKKLLQSTEKPIKEIAYVCGFAQSTTFTRAFTRKYKVAPSQYRQSQRPLP